MELEFFVEPGEDNLWHDKWIEERSKWWESQGVPKKKIKFLEVPENELSHYSKRTVDLMYKFPHGEEELEGIANRTDFDLGSHSKNQDQLNIQSKIKKNSDSNSRLAIQDKDTNEWIVPFVIEPSAGVERGVLAVLNEAYKVEKLEEGKERIVLALKPHLSPIKAAVIPLKKNNDDLVSLAKNVKDELQSLGKGRVLLENTGNIGKSYRKHDEVGTPMCITIDFDSLENNTVTIRDRDSMEQKTIQIQELTTYFSNFFK
jgi:glycyl-tRNA synthetase